MKTESVTTLAYQYLEIWAQINQGVSDDKAALGCKELTALCWRLVAMPSTSRLNAINKLQVLALEAIETLSASKVTQCLFTSIMDDFREERTRGKRKPVSAPELVQAS